MQRVPEFFRKRTCFAEAVAAVMLAACAVSQSSQPPIHDSGGHEVLVAAAVKPDDAAAADRPTTPARSAGAAKPSLESLRPRIPSTTQTVPLAKVGDKVITNQTLRHWLEVPSVFVTLPGERTPATAEEVLRLPADDLVKVVSRVCFYEMANQEALKTTDFVSTRVEAILDARRRDLLRERFVEVNVDAKNPPMTEAQARQWYKRNLNYFTRPTTFSAYTIFLSTYQPYELKRGDTLDGLAQRFLGDRGQFGRILDPARHEPLADLINLHPFVPFEPPKVGRVVLIPMSDEQKRAVWKRMELIMAELRGGADFVQMAQKYSEEEPSKRGIPVGPLPAPGRPILPEVLDAALSTTPGLLTPVLETPHGYTVLKIIDKEDEPVAPFEQVRDDLIAAELRRRRQEALEAIYEGLYDEPLLRIDRKAILTDGAPDKMVIARAGKFEYTWGDYRRDTGRTYSAPEGYANRVALLRQSERLRQALVDEKIRRQGLDKDPVAVSRIDANEMVFRGGEYLDWHLKNRIEVSEQALRAFYDKTREDFREPGEYRVRELILKLTPEEAQNQRTLQALTLYLRDTVKPALTSERRFVTKARELGTWPVEERDRGDLKTVPGDYRGAEFANQLPGLEPGATHGPFLAGDEMFLVWLDRRSKAEYRPFNSVKDEVEAAYRRARRSELTARAEETMRERHDLEYLFTWKDGGSE